LALKVWLTLFRGYPSAFYVLTVARQADISEFTFMITLPLKSTVLDCS